MRNLLAAVLLASASAPALAADPGLPMEAPPVTFSWTGGYVGGQLGYAWNDVLSERIYGGPNKEPDANGILGGLYAGYNYQFDGGLLLGVDADWAWQNNQGRFQQAGWFDWVSNLDWSASVRGRIGFAMDRFMPYIAGGKTWARADVGFDHASLGIVEGEPHTLSGWTIGGGLEYAATDNWLLRAEYRYSDFGSWEQMLPDIAPEKISVKANDIRLGVAYKF